MHRIPQFTIDPETDALEIRAQGERIQAMAIPWEVVEETEYGTLSFAPQPFAADPFVCTTLPELFGATSEWVNTEDGSLVRFMPASFLFKRNGIVLVSEGLTLAVG
jgi:hypothetical protein